MSWQEVQASDGTVYYHNSATNESVREKPEELYTPLDKQLYKTQWRQNRAEGGKVYYYHLQTGESVWDVPDEVQKLMDGESGASVVATVDADVPTPKEETNDSKYSKYQNNSKLITRSRSKTPKEQEELFIEMLREEKVDSTWSFSRVLSHFIQDTRYWAIEDSLHKKQIFESYLNNRSKEELMRESGSVEKFKSSFVELLKSKKEVVYYTRWKSVKRLIESEPIYAHSVIGEKIKRETFEEYVSALRRDHEEKEMALKDQALKELKEYFKSMNLGIESTWETTLNFIKQDTRFKQNRHFEVLDQLDLINCYHAIVVELQKEEKVLLKQQMRLNYRFDRVARDGFRQLLTELKEGGLLRADTTWAEIYELIQEDDRFLQMIGRNGSTVLELFNDVIEEEELLIRGKKAVVEQVLLHNNFIIDDHCDLKKQMAEMMTVLSQDAQTKEYDDDTIELVYEKLIKDVGEQKEKDRFAQERKLRRLQEEFRAMLGEKGVTEKSKWEEIKTRLGDTPEFQALGDDDLREQSYNKYISRLIEKKKEEEQRKQEEVKRIIASATQARENNRKRPHIEHVVEELDY